MLPHHIITYLLRQRVVAPCFCAWRLVFTLRAPGCVIESEREADAKSRHHKSQRSPCFWKLTSHEASCEVNCKFDNSRRNGKYHLKIDLRYFHTYLYTTQHCFSMAKIVYEIIVLFWARQLSCTFDAREADEFAVTSTALCCTSDI